MYFMFLLISLAVHLVWLKDTTDAFFIRITNRFVHVIIGMSSVRNLKLHSHPYILNGKG